MWRPTCILRRLAEKVGKRYISTTSPRMDQVVREIRDLGFAPKFRDEFYKKKLATPRPDMNLWHQYDAWIIRLVNLSFILILYHQELEWQAIDNRIIVENFFREEDQERLSELEKMYDKYIDDVWQKHGII